MRLCFFYRWNPEQERWVECDRDTYQWLRFFSTVVVMARENQIVIDKQLN